MIDITKIEFTLIAIIIIAIVITIFLDAGNRKEEKLEFIEYCQSKGNSQDDCKWEWKRLENGERSNLIFIKM